MAVKKALPYQTLAALFLISIYRNEKAPMISHKRLVWVVDGVLYSDLIFLHCASDPAKRLRCDTKISCYMSLRYPLTKIRI